MNVLPEDEIVRRGLGWIQDRIGHQSIRRIDGPLEVHDSWDRHRRTELTAADTLKRAAHDGTAEKIGERQGYRAGQTILTYRVTGATWCLTWTVATSGSFGDVFVADDFTDHQALSEAMDRIDRPDLVSERIGRALQDGWRTTMVARARARELPGLAAGYRSSQPYTMADERGRPVAETPTEAQIAAARGILGGWIWIDQSGEPVNVTGFEGDVAVLDGGHRVTADTVRQVSVSRPYR